jgi:hypothetical protein
MTAPNLVQPPSVIPPWMAPLDASWEDDDVEADFKDAVMAVLNAMIVPRINQIHTYGMAHRGEFATVERAIKAAGLAMDRQSSRIEYMREVYRMWVARNPKRGLGFLQAYCRLLYPGGATVEQLWQRKDLPYTQGLTASPPNTTSYFLTSRVRVRIAAAEDLSTTDLTRARAVMQSIVPAKIVLEMQVAIGGTDLGEIALTNAMAGVAMGSIAVAGTMAPA